jgi:hypothetical protein
MLEPYGRFGSILCNLLSFLDEPSNMSSNILSAIGGICVDLLSFVLYFVVNLMA